MLLERIQKFNQGRELTLLALKYRQMQANPFSFFRATCHLFYEDWPRQTDLNKAPSIWVCGDLHLENLGAYKGSNRLSYFDLNDFDEAALAPCTWDLTRFVTSIFVGMHTLGVNEADTLTLCSCALDAYTHAVVAGHAYMVEQEIATGMVEDLLDRLEHRNRQVFLDERTKLIKGKRVFQIDDKRTQAISEAERFRVTKFMKSWSSDQADPAFFKLLDVAHRIAGTSSLGLDRYVLLIEGKGSSNQNYLLDLKEARTSALHPYLLQPQPQWVNQADRVVSSQKHIQGCPPDLIAAVEIEDKPYILRELQPTQDRLNLTQWDGKFQRLKKVVKTMAEVIAWGQLRSCGYRSAASLDELIAFAQENQWQKILLRHAQEYSHQVEADYHKFLYAQLV